jgi:hypothetical protein
LDDPQQKKWYYFGTDRDPDLLKCNARLIFIRPNLNIQKPGIALNLGYLLLRI